MPELPEVEVTARALSGRFAGRTIEALRVHNPRLRWPVPATLARTVTGQTVLAVERRGKYLLWRLPAGVLISHLGMSGSWSILDRKSSPARGTHDHVELESDGAVARYHDPRRFGALLWHGANRGQILHHPLLAQLGIEPFDPHFDGAYLYAATRGRASPIKPLLLAGKIVVGVGNIYATESLFAARIHPRTPAGQIGRVRFERLAQAVRSVLQRAIEAGGSTLRDFRGTEGLAGRYTEFAQAYDRQGKPCLRCGTPIRRCVQGQRATYFCPVCQRR